MLRKSLVAVLTATVLVVPSIVRATDDPFADIKGLYDSASYEEALDLLKKTAATTEDDRVEQYQALCLLALGRTSEAEEALVRLVKRRPMLTFDEQNYPPRLIALHQAVRQRVLPDVIKGRYDAAKTTFENGDYAKATAEFRDVADLLAIPEATASAAQLSDLRMLAEGFLVVAEQKAKSEQLPAAAASPAPRSAQTAAAATTAPSTPASSSRQTKAGTQSGPSRQSPTGARQAPASTASAASSAPRVVSPSAAANGGGEGSAVGVTPPVAIDQTMPAWNPPAALRMRAYHGAMRIVIDENGQVTDADIVQPVNDQYDAALLVAAKKWRFVPAQADGKPIRYEKTIEVSLSPGR